MILQSGIKILQHLYANFVMTQEITYVKK